MHFIAAVPPMQLPKSRKKQFSQEFAQVEISRRVPENFVRDAKNQRELRLSPRWTNPFIS